MGVEGDGSYGVDFDPRDFDAPSEERAAVGGTRGFEAPGLIRADQILADGVRLPFANAQGAAARGPVVGVDLVVPGDGRPSASSPPAVRASRDDHDPRSDPGRGVLTNGDVATILPRAPRQTGGRHPLAAIRQPRGQRPVSLAW